MYLYSEQEMVIKMMKSQTVHRSISDCFQQEIAHSNVRDVMMLSLATSDIFIMQNQATTVINLNQTSQAVDNNARQETSA